jgi:amidase
MSQRGRLSSPRTIYILLRMKLSGVACPDAPTGLSAVAQARAVRAREVRARELVEASLRRMDEIDPLVNCMGVVRADAALAEADAVEARVRAGEELPLAGVVTAVKENAALAGERLQSGTASPEPRGTHDAKVVRRLRAAGAVVIGTSAMRELAMGAATESPTWGIIRNPHALDRTPGGSSGGWAVAVAAHLVALAQGDDGGASIRVPAACCGLVGLKPQRGRIPTTPHPERWVGLTPLGFRAPRRSRCSAGPAHHRRRPTRFLVGRPAARGNGAQAAATRPGVRRGRPGHPRHRRPAHEHWGTVCMRSPQTGACSARRSSRATSPVRPRSGPGWPIPDRRTRSVATWGTRMPARLLRHALESEARHRARLLEMFGDADVLLTPTTTKPAPPAGELLKRGAVGALVNMSAFIAFTAPGNVTGQPATSVPAGHDHTGVPLGAQLVARPGRKDVLLYLATQLEVNKPPKRTHLT